MYIYWEFPLAQKTANIKHTLLFIITHLFIFCTAVLVIHCFVSTRKKLQNFDQDKKLPLLPLMLGTKLKKMILGNEWKYELIHFFPPQGCYGIKITSHTHPISSSIKEKDIEQTSLFWTQNSDIQRLIKIVCLFVFKLTSGLLFLVSSTFFPLLSKTTDQ